MKIKLRKNLATRNANDGSREILKKGVLEIDDKRGKWLIQSYPLVCSEVIGEAILKPEPVKAVRVAEKPKPKPKAKRGRPKKKGAK